MLGAAAVTIPRAIRLVLGTSLVASITACSSAGPESTATGTSTAALESRADAMMQPQGNPDLTAAATTVDGVATWLFYVSPQGLLVQAADPDGNTQAEVAFVVDGSGTTVQAVGYAIQPSLGIAPGDLAQAAMTDLQTVELPVDTASVHASRSIHLQDDSLTVCGNILVTLALGSFEWTAIVVGGTIAALTCPETVGVGCFAGASIIVGGVALGSAACQDSANGSAAHASIRRE